MTSPNFTPYSTLNPFFPASLPSWIPDELDQQRIESYRIYEQIYWNVPQTFKLVHRGTDDKPVYIPSAKTIIEATHRYTAPDFGFTVRALDESATDTVRITQARQVLEDLFRRERFFSKFAGNKRYGLIRGDWCWHITADPSKPPGRRLSITPLDPASYFPVWDPNDLDRIIGCHIVDHFTNDDGDAKIKRTTYRKNETPGGPITVEEAIFPTDAWNGPKAKPDKVLRTPTVLTGITELPVYHVKNFEEPANPFGSSEVRGLERIITAVNQSISDEELTLALQGLGMYGTDADPPTDEDGNELDWMLGPGRVVEYTQGRKFDRIDGVGSVAPFLDHMNWMMDRMRESSATPDIAIGAVDVSVASSGIALKLQMSPMLAKAEEKDQVIEDVHAQMFYDLTNQWLPVYESMRFDGLRIDPVMGDKLPVDRTAKLKELNDMYDRQIITAAYYRQEAQKLGYEFPDDIGLDVIQEQMALAAAYTPGPDPFGTRMNAEMSDGQTTVTSGEGQDLAGNVGQ